LNHGDHGGHGDEGDRPSAPRCQPVKPHVLSTGLFGSVSVVSVPSVVQHIILSVILNHARNQDDLAPKPALDRSGKRQERQAKPSPPSFQYSSIPPFQYSPPPPTAAAAPKTARTASQPDSVPGIPLGQQTAWSFVGRPRNSPLSATESAEDPARPRASSIGRNQEVPPREKRRNVLWITMLRTLKSKSSTKNNVLQDCSTEKGNADRDLTDLHRFGITCERRGRTSNRQGVNPAKPLCCQLPCSSARPYNVYSPTLRSVSTASQYRRPISLGPAWHVRCS